MEVLAALPPTMHLAIALIFGLLVGSFLNVVIFRLPPGLKYQWYQEAQSWIQQENINESAPPGIVLTASHCQYCKTPIAAWHNIPVISYLLLRGKCTHCAAPISGRYPLVELLTALLTAAVIWRFGWSAQALFAILLTWCLIALAFIDYDHYLLPDNLVLPFLWLGLALSIPQLYTTPTEAIVGAMAGYLVLWLVYQAFKLLTGKEGMGYGDFKLLALFGAWLGWQALPQILLLSAVSGSIIGGLFILLGKHQSSKPIPFGPFLAIAGWIALLYGQQINQAYLQFSSF